MSSSSISFSHMNVQQRKPFSIERRPKLLKDFLNDNSNSCSSSGFKSFPRHQPLNLKNIDPKQINSIPNPNPKKASPIAISAKFQALINAVKNIPKFTTVKSPSFLPRSLSRRLSKRGSKSTKKEVKISVRVKDILRWTSFHDVAEAKAPPLDLSPSPSLNHHTITTTGSSTVNDSSSNSTINSSTTHSWCESDFTAEFLPSWCGNNTDEINELEKMSKKDLRSNVGVDLDATIDTGARDPQDIEEFELYDEDEQQSPVSVFDFDQFRENEESFSTNFDQSLANVERTRQQLIQKIKEFESLSSLKRSIEVDDEEEELNSHYDEEIGEEEEEEEECGMVEEKAREMLVYVKATSATKITRVEEELLFDLFRDELNSLENQCSKYIGYNWDMVSLAKAWLSGELSAFDHGLDHCTNREAYFREMNKVGNWSEFEFEFEQEGLAMEIGDEMMGQLLDDLLVDLLVN